MFAQQKFASISWCAALAVAGMLLTAGLVRADDGLAMAPPVDIGNVQPVASTNNVFNFTEVPANQEVPITRAVFDESGYTLYDSVGETIVVPFTNDNLYVMKFAVSPNRDTYFVNEDGVPVLFLPEDGRLENATVAGAYWYPFTNDFQPQTPVYLGIAPSWGNYVGMDWYPDMDWYGGYWCATAGGNCEPSFGLAILIGDFPCYGWNAYRGYCSLHPARFHTGFLGGDRESLNQRGIQSGHAFRGGSSVHGGFQGDSAFRGSDAFQGNRGFSNGAFRSNPTNGSFRNGAEYHRSWSSGGGSTYRAPGTFGGYQGSRSSGAAHSSGESRSFGSDENSSGSGGSHGFSGGGRGFGGSGRR